MREELHWLPNHNHSFIPAISIAPLQVLYHLEALPLQHRYCIGVSRRSAQTTVGKGLAQGPYVTAGVEPTTLRLKVIDSTKAPSRPTIIKLIKMHLHYVMSNSPCDRIFVFIEVAIFFFLLFLQA